jgi:hypothetical protein
MVLVLATTHYLLVILVNVNLVSMVPTVKSIFDHVNQILVGTMVISIYVHVIKYIFKNIFVYCLGVCNETSNTTFNCSCQPGWMGLHCQTKINYCEQVKCLNKGVCRPLLLNFTCECLGTSYSGRYCEITSRQTFIYQVISKSFGYLAIFILVCTVSFFVIMDILKYCFGIDPTKHELEKYRRKKMAKKMAKKIKHRPVIQRFIYVNPPPPTGEPISTIQQTNV